MCLVLEHLFVLKMLSSSYSTGNGDAVTYSAGNGGQIFYEGFSETAPLRRSNTPSAKGHTNSRPFSCGKRACALCPNSTYIRVLHFSASYIFRATLAREPIFWGGFSPKAPPLPPPMYSVHFTITLEIATSIFTVSCCSFQYNPLLAHVG